ncbi:MAG: transglycosylase SLT domain-containing protein [Treponema sp.]|jgi:hypothetical protein|nr:transglycosylase SLT domain-containing protein [Treponema sp.]
MLVAMYIGALAASKFLFLPQTPPEILPPPEESLKESSPLQEISSAFLQEPEIVTDEVMDCYVNPESREWVIGFFAQLCGSAELAGSILEESERRGISPSLAFALCWEESRYNKLAVNHRNQDGSVDRGLFQLNSRSFPKLSEADFFNPRINVYHGIAHLRLCLDTGGSEIAALAMYNAGSVRVRTGGTPSQTLDYTARILSSRRKIDAVFREEWSRTAAELAAMPEEPLESSEPAGPEEAAMTLLPIMLLPLSR